MYSDFSYYTDDDTDILQMMNSQYQQNITLQQQFWIQADMDLRYKAGDQNLYSEIYGYQFYPAQQRQFVFNRIRRYVNMIVGHQRKNRKSTIVTGRDGDDQRTADDLSDVLQWVHTTENMYHTISDAFENAVTTGISLICPWISYQNDPVSGDIKLSTRNFNGFLIDTQFKNYDLSDASFIWTRRWVNRRQAKMLLPGRDKEIDEMPYQVTRDEKFMFLAQNYQFSMRKLLSYDEFWYLDDREATFLIDPETGETTEWTGDKDNLRAFKQVYSNIIVEKRRKPTVKLAIVLNGRVMYKGPNPYNIDRYPFVPILCYFEPEIPYFWWKMQGVVRGLRDPQFLYNRRKRIELDMLESQINSGIKVKEDALIDIHDAFKSGQGQVLVVKKTASLDDVQKIDPPVIDASTFTVSQGLAQEMGEISGVSEELLGLADDSDVGITTMLRQGAALTTLQTIFDNLDLSQKILGEVVLEMIQKNFEPGKIQKITKREPSPRFYDKAFTKYDCVVEEGVMTTTQKQMEFVQRLKLRELGIPVPVEELLRTVSMQGKDKFIQAVKAEEEKQAEAQQQQVQQQMHSQQIIDNSLISKAESDKALAAERLNKVKLDAALSAERIQRAVTERDEATLARVRAAKELVDIDLSQLERAINIIKSLQQEEAQEPQPSPT